MRTIHKVEIRDRIISKLAITKFSPVMRNNPRNVRDRQPKNMKYLSTFNNLRQQNHTSNHTNAIANTDNPYKGNYSNSLLDPVQRIGDTRWNKMYRKSQK